MEASAAVGQRQTIIAQGRLAMRALRLDAARAGRHGVQILAIEQVAARLAGGFVRPLDDETLLSVIQTALPETPLGELDGIRLLPGMPGAAADTLRKAWLAGVDLQARAADHPRLLSMARLERAVLERLPAGVLAPPALARAAMDKITLAPRVLGAVECTGLADLAPCWRPMLLALGAHVPVLWTAGPRAVPAWLAEVGEGFEGGGATVGAGCRGRAGVSVTMHPPAGPTVTTVSAATARHEAVEAMRWVRQLLASGAARPEEIAIAAVSPADYDEDFLALRADASLDLHFVHGVTVLASRDGQAAAALADIVVRGLTQVRLRRLARLCAGGKGLLGGLPSGWSRMLPPDAPMTSDAAWDRWLARIDPTDWPEGQDHSPALRDALGLLRQRTDGARAAGEALLEGRALAIWRRALLAGPPAAVDVTLGSLRQDDGLEACASVAWMPAASLAAAPRRFVRLLGLNSSRWPRGVSEDRLLPGHIIPAAQLDPLPVIAMDRRDFRHILATTQTEVVLSRARRDAEGRLLGRSPLLHGMPQETYLRADGPAAHAFSETDRLLSRLGEFAELPQARAAQTCWRNWHSTVLTPHDGRVRLDHPVIAAALARTQSASSLSLLLRNPLGFVWRYALGWKAPTNVAEPILLDALSMGNLVHLVLDDAVRRLEQQGGLAAADGPAIDAAVQAAVVGAATEWEAGAPVPPPIIWARTKEDVAMLASRALRHRDAEVDDALAYGEVPFGGALPRPGAQALPWDSAAPVEIPGTGFRIRGYIDRLDIRRDGSAACVTDYKTGRLQDPAGVLRGGKELQRCLYAFAVRALLGEQVAIRAALLYPRDDKALPLEDAGRALADLSFYLRAARDSLMSGAAVAGIDAGGTYDDLLFALPANAHATYLHRKQPAILECLGIAAQVWDAE